MRVAPFPGPSDPVWDEPGEGMIDVGELVPDEPAAVPPLPSGNAEPAEPAPPLGDAGPVTPDEPPAHARKGWGRQDRQSRPAPKATRVTAAIRGDVQAKVQILLGVPGSVWAARDPLCGGTFMEGLPQTSAAFTAWICQSPDLLNWFTGPGGNFMLILDILAALMPTATVVMGHHVYHSIELEESAGQDQARYAA
jgi:hypothetical protein